MAQAPLLGSASASLFLNAFVPDPLTGSIGFPALTRPSSFQIASCQLTNETIPDFQKTVDRLLREGEGLVDASDAGCPCPVTAAKDGWAITEFMNFGVSRYTCLKRGDGRMLFVYRSEEKIEAAAGIQTDHVAALLSNACDLTTHRVSTTYHMAFFSEGVRRLRAALGLESVSLSEVAMALSAVIQDSGQYPSETLRRRTRVYHSSHPQTPLENPKDLKRMPAAAWNKIGLSFGSPDHFLPGVLMPEALMPGNEYLDLTLENDDLKSRGERMALNPKLKESLWDVSEILARTAVSVFHRH